MRRYQTIMIIIMFSSLTLFSAEKSAKQYMSDLEPSNSEETIVNAANWLGEKKEKKAVNKLISLVNDERTNVRIYSIVALGLIGDEKAVNTLNNKLLDDQSADVRYAALLAIARIGSKKSKSALEQAQNQETDPFIKDFLNKLEEKLLGK